MNKNSRIYNLANYRQIFDLQDKDLHKSILDCSADISSFNAEMHALHYSVISINSLYTLSSAEMQQKIAPIDAELNSQQLFMQDYAVGKKEGRYLPLTMPLPFNDHQFELALCADLLSHQHADLLMNELCRVAAEVRIFPLLNKDGALIEALGPIMLALYERNLGVEVREISWGEEKTGQAMLRIWATECIVEKSV